MNEQENRNNEQQEKDLFAIGKDFFEKVKTKLVGEEQPGSSAATTFKIIGKVIIIIFVIGGCIGGGGLGYFESPIYGIGYDVNTIIFGAIGAVAGLIVGAAISLFFKYFAELGENMKIAAKATETTANKTQNNSVTDVEQLQKYKELLDSGIITQEEFDAKKKQILGL